MSAMVTSGVASFSTYRASRPSHAIGVVSPSVGQPRAARAADRVERIVVDLAARHDRDLIVEQRDERAKQARLRLPAQAEQDEVVLRQQRVHELRHDGVVVADDAREERLAGAELADQVLAHFLVHVAARHARRRRWRDADRADGGTGLTVAHRWTVSGWWLVVLGW